MTIELCRFSLQDVSCSLKLTVLLILLLLMISLMVCSFVYGNIAGFRVWRMIACRKLDMTSAFGDNQNFVSRILSCDCVRRPLTKGAVCLLMMFVTGVITMLHCVIFLAK